MIATGTGARPAPTVAVAQNGPMVEGVGARLRRARTERGLELAEVEAATKIQRRLLAAMEEEEWERLPGEYYVRAFLREYAEFLGLDSGEVLDLYEPEPESTRAEPPLRQIKAPPRLRSRWGRGPLWLRVSSVLVAVGALVAVVAIVVSNLGGGETRAPSPEAKPPAAAPAPAGEGETTEAEAQPAPSRGTKLTLLATAEVWVCLLDRRGEPLVDGQILAAGTEVGPFHSGAYTLSLGNGEVEVTLDDSPAPIPASSDPVGYAIDASGTLRELPPEERPTCT